MTLKDVMRKARETANPGERPWSAFLRVLNTDPEAFNEVYGDLKTAFNSLTSKDVCRVAGVEERTLRAWQLRGLLTLTDTRAGKWRRYSFTDLLSVALMKRLTCAGLSAHYAADSIKSNRQHWENPFRRFYLVFVYNDAADTMVYHPTRDPDAVRGFLECEPDVMAVVPVHMVAFRVFDKLHDLMKQTEA